MFMRFLRSFSPSTRKNIVLSQNANRFFSNAIHASNPHSEEHLAQQQKLFRLHNLFTNVSCLSKGTELVGLSLDLAEPCYLGTAPLYNPEILKSLSQNEWGVWLDMTIEFEAKVQRYELLCDVSCVMRFSENGVPVYYINPVLLEEKNGTFLNDLAGCPDEEGLACKK